MILEKIDDKRMLIALSREDMDILDLTFTQITVKSSHLKRIVKNILTKSEPETGFFIDDNCVMIEAIPQNNWCFVLVTLLSKKHAGRRIFKVKKELKPYVFGFKSSENLLCVIERVYKTKEKNFKNMLFEHENRYYLLLYLKNHISTPLLIVMTEYGELVGKNYMLMSKIIECGKLIVKDDAIGRIGKHLAEEQNKPGWRNKK